MAIKKNQWDGVEYEGRRWAGYVGLVVMGLEFQRVSSGVRGNEGEVWGGGEVRVGGAFWGRWRGSLM